MGIPFGLFAKTKTETQGSVQGSTQGKVWPPSRQFRFPQDSLILPHASTKAKLGDLVPVILLDRCWMDKLDKKNVKLKLPLGKPDYISVFFLVRNLVQMYRSIGFEPLLVVNQSAWQSLDWYPFYWELACNSVRVIPLAHETALWGCLHALISARYILLHPVRYPFVRPSGMRLLLRALYEPHTSKSSGIRPIASEGYGWPRIIHNTTLQGLAQGRLTWQSLEKSMASADVADEFVTKTALGLSAIQLAASFDAQKRLAPMEAKRLLRLFSCPERGIRHALAVGHVAQAFAKCYLLAGKPMDPDLACAAGYVHDIAKGFKKHEQVGAMWLNILGLSDLAHCIRDHRDLLLADSKPVTERELVYLADKYCFGPRFVPLVTRFTQKFELFAGNQKAQVGIAKRLLHAQKLEQRISKELGLNVEEIARNALLA